MSDDQDEPEREPSVEEAPVIGLQGKPVLYPSGPWEAAVDDRGRLARDANGRLLRVR